jgi:hypothetical protein
LFFWFFYFTINTALHPLFFIILSRAIVLFDDPTLAFLLLSNRESCNVVSEWGSMATVSCTLVPVLTPSSSPSSLPPYTFYMKGNLRFPLDCFGLAVFKIYSAFHEKARWKQKYGEHSTSRWSSSRTLRVNKLIKPRPHL